MPAFRAFRALRAEIVERERRRLRLDELKPRVLTSFVRNRLINEVYLPLIGDNLAKQIGAAGESKRTDLMGLLLLVSPPGYGKTTLMEYVASRLGLVFMKVNGPALGHEVTSLDPAEAPNATARQEVEKINLAFEMGNNVMLYLDDIQHTNPELLQKFISLCDAQRRIEGVWKGQTRTYDLRGKKFCVVMAGQSVHGVRREVPDPRHAGEPRRHLQPRRHPPRQGRALRALLRRERAHLQPGARAARRARARRRLQAHPHGEGRGGPGRPTSRTPTPRRERGDRRGALSGCSRRERCSWP